ncbi:RhuM family protein [Stenotrophomonas maltophilia]|uniref:RhuM family protein n=1 Tax=Stenotrophomonas maltophilia TaxID=40324 RepID=UPI0039F66EF3
MNSPLGELILYRTDDGRTEVHLRAAEGTVWMTQGEMAELFDTTPQNITQHVRAVYDEGEIDESTTCKDYLQVRREGGRDVRRNVKTYRLELILAVGFRVRSPRSLTHWQGERIRKSDAVVSKNYLGQQELEQLNRLVTMFLDFAEDRAERRIEMRMADWLTQTDRFLDFNERAILEGAGHVSHQQMEAIIAERYGVFDRHRRNKELGEAEQEAIEDLRQLEAEAKALTNPALKRED